MLRTPRVARLRKRGDVRSLVAALSYQDVVRDRHRRPVDLGVAVRIEALFALAELGDEGVRAPIVDCLSDPVPNVRVAAVRALRALGPTAVAEPLVRGVVGWPMPPYGQARAEALGVLVDVVDRDLANTTVEAISAQERAQLDKVTQAAFAWLVCRPLGAEETARLLIGKLGAPGAKPARLETMLGWVGEGAIDTLIHGLSDRALRESLASALGKLKAGRAVPGLVDCLTDEAPRVRRAATGALADIRDPRAIEALLRATEDEDLEVRQNAQGALDRLGTTSIVTGFAALLCAPMVSTERLDVEGQAFEALPETVLSPEAGEVWEGNGHPVPDHRNGLP